MSTKKTSLVTSCPACAANFYVTPEQLSAYRGEVRCGKCSHVFNALDRLSDSSEPEEADVTPVMQTEQHEEIEILEPTPDASMTKSEAAPINIADFSARPSVTIGSQNFVVGVASKTNLNRPGRRKFSAWLPALLVLMFALLAATQATYYMRAQIVAKWPALTPHFDKACAFLDCAVELPRRTEFLAIDDSALQEDAERQGLIHLSSTIINNAPFVQAYPLFELTLTDAYDKPLLRRAFAPHEYLPAGADISRGLGAGEELRIRLSLTVGGETVAGYRVFVAYP